MGKGRERERERARKVMTSFLYMWSMCRTVCTIYFYPSVVLEKQLKHMLSFHHIRIIRVLVRIS